MGGSGGSVCARGLVVEQRRWIDDRDFADILSFCQFMPGPNIVGVAVCVGSRVRGPIGALAGVAGFTLIPLTISFSVGAWCLRNTDLGMLQGLLSSISAAASGLVIGTGLRLLAAHRDRPMSLSFAGLAFCGLVFTKLPLLAVLLALAPLSFSIAAIFNRRAR